jgi:hypothetical protein
MVPWYVVTIILLILCIAGISLYGYLTLDNYMKEKELMLAEKDKLLKIREENVIKNEDFILRMNKCEASIDKIKEIIKV